MTNSSIVRCLVWLPTFRICSRLRCLPCKCGKNLSLCFRRTIVNSLLFTLDEFCVFYLSPQTSTGETCGISELIRLCCRTRADALLPSHGWSLVWHFCSSLSMCSITLMYAKENIVLSSSNKWTMHTRYLYTSESSLCRNIIVPALKTSASPHEFIQKLEIWDEYHFRYHRLPWKWRSKESMMWVTIVWRVSWEPPTILGRTGRSGWVGRVLELPTTLLTLTLRTATKVYTNCK